MSKFSVLCALGAMLLLAGCGENSRGRAGRLSGAFRYDAQGAPYEIVVVADHDVWDGPAGDTLRAMFYKQYPMVNRQETTFDVLRVLPAGFKTLTTRHRNIMITDINPASYAEASLSLSRDTYARPQIVLTATAPDVESLTRLIDDNRDDIMLVLETTEKDRDVASATTHTPSQIAGLIEQKFGFEMATGPGYEVRSESDNFLWLSYEMPTSSQGIIIYSYPLAGEEDFDRDNLLLRRSEFVSRIPGENPGSYMTSVPEYVDLIYKRIDGRQWSEMHGFWDVEGDYMGGPYTNYSTLDAARGRIIAIDFYVYSPDPRLSQRSYIKQLEHLVYTVKIPDAAPSGE